MVLDYEQVLAWLREREGVRIGVEVVSGGKRFARFDGELVELSDERRGVLSRGDTVPDGFKAGDSELVLWRDLFSRALRHVGGGAIDLHFDGNVVLTVAVSPYQRPR